MKKKTKRKNSQGWPCHSVGRAQQHRNQVGWHTAAVPHLGRRGRKQGCKVIFGCNQWETSLGYLRPSQKRICKYLCDSPSCSLQWPLSPHRGRRVNCTVRLGGASKVPSFARLCSQAIPASPLSSPTTNLSAICPSRGVPWHGTVCSPLSHP